MFIKYLRKFFKVMFTGCLKRCFRVYSDVIKGRLKYNMFNASFPILECGMKRVLPGEINLIVMLQICNIIIYDSQSCCITGKIMTWILPV
jgi:hypothetical protein